MRKAIVVLLGALALGHAFADANARFFRDGELLDTMYVNSPEGLKIRDQEGLDSKRVAGIANGMPLKVIRLGKAETIDGLTAPWVKVLVPRYLWATAGTHYGWVYGGYLSERRPAFSAKGWKARDLAEYLARNYWREYVDDEEEGYAFDFNLNGEKGAFWRGKLGSGIGEGGTWKAISGNEVSFNTTNVMESEEDCQWSLEFAFYPDGSVSYEKYHLYPDFACIMEITLQDTEGYYRETKGGRNFVRWVIDTDWITDKDSLVREAIEAGISAEGTKYDELYHRYWKDRERPSWE